MWLAAAAELEGDFEKMMNSANSEFSGIFEGNFWEFSIVIFFWELGVVVGF